MRKFRQIAIVLALTATLLRALLPEGWMPNPTGVSGVPVVLCTAYGMEHIVLDADGKPVKPQDSQHSDICAFAGVAHLAQASSAPTVFAPTQTATVASIRAPRQEAPTRGLRHAINPRAPPTLA